MPSVARLKPPPAADEYPAVAALERDGMVILGDILDPGACAAMLGQARAIRDFGPALFLDEAGFLADPQYTGVNPRPGRNLYEQVSAHHALVEGNAVLGATLGALLGSGWTVLNAKFVCGVPESWIPDWVLARIRGNPVNNLGCFMRPEVRDVTYFYGIDFHQDLIDWKDREPDFLTVYAYLHDVGAEDAPLHVLPGSHALGATVFPHQLARDPADPAMWTYGDGAGGALACRQHVLTGSAGHVALWHACTLHGTMPDTADRERISLRFLIARDPGAAPGSVAIDRINATLSGARALSRTRRDVNAAGAAAIKQNVLFAARQG
ncbi:phytanoyl-CoA dioxygenase family protein [Zavarzinia sp. CC-PAN008]|uniref:phytanoyl-CoA dioxygenase family protein n=1 Tax=Zavarzinia sp. CC-PAN008 TaxID=3243332 RepID=UPI003F74719F